MPRAVTRIIGLLEPQTVLADSVALTG
jgi:hypothetical protein